MKIGNLTIKRNPVLDFTFFHAERLGKFNDVQKHFRSGRRNAIRLSFQLRQNKKFWPRAQFRLLGTEQGEIIPLELRFTAGPFKSFSHECGSCRCASMRART